MTPLSRLNCNRQLFKLRIVHYSLTLIMGSCLTPKRRILLLVFILNTFSKSIFLKIILYLFLFKFVCMTTCTCGSSNHRFISIFLFVWFSLVLQCLFVPVQTVTVHTYFQLYLQLVCLTAWSYIHMHSSSNCVNKDHTVLKKSNLYLLQ